MADQQHSHSSNPGPVFLPGEASGTGNFVPSLGGSLLTDPVRLFMTAVSYSWLIIACAISGLVMGSVYASLQTKQYRASLQINIDVGRASALREFEVVGESRSFFVTAESTIAASIRTRRLARRVVYELNLTEKPNFYIQPVRFSLVGILKRAITGRAEQPFIPRTYDERERAAINRVLAGMQITTLRRSPIVRIAFVHNERSYPHVVVNQIARSFIELSVDQKAESANKIRLLLQGQADLVKQQLTSAERELNDYAKSISFTDLEEQPAILASRLSAVNDALNAAVQDRLELGLIVQQITEGKAPSLSAVLESQAIEGLKQRLATLRADYQDKLSIYKPDFPEMVRLAGQIEDTQNQLAKEISIISDSFVLRLAQAQQREETLRQELALVTASSREYREKSVEFIILRREVDSKRSQFEALIEKLNNIGVGAELRSENVAVLDYAVRTPDFFSPRRSRIVVAAMAVMIMLSIVIIFILELINNRFSNPDQIESELELPLLGIVPFSDAGDDLHALDELDPALEEAYSSLRSAIQFSAIGGNLPSLSVTSSEPSEGKSITSYKIAEGFAKLGKRVILIDADLRRPKLHKWFGVANTLGLSTILADEVTPEDEADLYIESGQKNLVFMRAGNIPPNPTDLLGSNNMARLVHRLTKEFDLVIIDGPPVMGLADAPILARHTAATLYVVAANQATRPSVRHAINRLRASNVNLIGTVLTKFRLRRFDYNYAYSYARSDYYTYNPTET
ncbi:hypothetical protein AB838_01795 [Rhodobacteraceae bacterium (ex Bugula neritina AB1)]|nr:hypothetical protein AB838_01795 [Rhodobacteraceae bacterium (ex Bugula neritina AB1)]